MRAGHKDVDHGHDSHFSLDRAFQNQRRASIGRKVTSRPSLELLQRARTPAELLKIHHPSLRDGSASAQTSNSAIVPAGANSASENSTSSHRHGYHLTYHDLLRWIQKEKARRNASKSRRRQKRKEKEAQSDLATQGSIASDEAPTLVSTQNAEGQTSRRGSDASSEGSLALETLQDVLEQLSISDKHLPYVIRKNQSSRSLRKLKRLSTTASSDTELLDSEILVPSCDVFLDNSKTLSSSGGLTADDDPKPQLQRTISTREKGAWKSFKLEILKLTHTLRLRGWRRVPLEEPELINVERLSGALTNAVYVVSPPKDLPSMEDEDGSKKSKPRKLLLRIYGSQVDHLIDRESELQILKRLSKKHIGPRLLATFQNGRFEEFLNARALTSEELHSLDISRQIAKRMRELHDGVELINSEIEAGPFVWQNINKWISRAEYIVKHLENGIAQGDPEMQKLSVKNLFVGADFELFKSAISKYEQWLQQVYKGGEWEIRERLVFAHNDVCLRTLSHVHCHMAITR
jgi:choline kinase